MVKLVNRAKMTTATTGTGTITLGSAVDGFQNFDAAGVADADVVRYVIEDGTAWEIGEGVYSSAGGTLTRTPSESSIGGGAITLTGNAEVFLTAAGEDIVQPGDNISTLTNDAGFTANTGTVTSVAASAGTGINVTGSPITTSGTLTITNTAPHIPTDLSYTTAASTGTVNSSTGNNATLPAATTSAAGLLTSADKTKLDGIAAGAQVNVGTNLGITGTGNTRTITSSTGSNVTVPVATTTTAGLMATGDKSKLDGIAEGAQVNTVSSVAGKTGAVTLVKGDVGLGDVDNTSDADKPISTATQTALNGKVDTTDSRLTNAREWSAGTIAQAEAEAGTATTRRAFTAQRVRQAILGWWNGSSDKAKLDGIETGAQVNMPTNLGYTSAASAGTLTSSTGSNATLPAATTSVAGLLTSADKTKLDGIAAGAQVNVGTNLGITGTGDTRTLTSSTGTNVTIPVATTTTAGWLSTADKTKLDGIAAGAQVNVATNLTYSTAASSGTVNSSTGTNATIPAATTSLAGLLTGADKTKLDGIQAGAQVNVGTNLGSSGTGGTRTITSSTGSDTSITYTAADLGAVTTSRTVSTSGIATGGGDLSANRTINVPGTNLAMGGSGNSRTITSSTGNNVSVPVATTSNAGFMATGDKTKLDGVEAGAQVNVATNLGYTTAASTGTVTSSTGTNATIPAATTSLAGLLTSTDKTKLDGIATGATANTGTVTSVAASAGTGISVSGSPITSSGTLTITNTAPHQATNLGITGTGDTRTITSSTGTNVTIPVATTTTAGWLSTADKTKLDGIQAGAQVNVATNLTYSTAATTGTVNSSTGTNATIPAATTSLAGLMTNADKTKLNGIEAGAQVNVGTNLGQGGSGNSRTITSSTGSNVTVSTATTSNAGFMSTNDKTKLDGIQAGAQVNVGTNLGSSGTGATRTITSSTGSSTSITYSAADVGAVSQTSQTGAAEIPVGTEAQRPTPAAGQLRFNSDAGSFEGYNGTAWGSIGGGAVDDLFYENAQVVANNYTIPTGRNAMTTGPIDVNPGVVVTVSAGSRWVII